MAGGSRCALRLAEFLRLVTPHVPAWAALTGEKLQLGQVREHALDDGVGDLRLAAVFTAPLAHDRGRYVFSGGNGKPFRLAKQFAPSPSRQTLAPSSDLLCSSPAALALSTPHAPPLQT